MDDDDLENELAEMEELEADEVLNDFAAMNFDAQAMPSASINVAQQQQEDDELMELEAMMSGDYTPSAPSKKKKKQKENKIEKAKSGTFEGYNNGIIKITFEWTQLFNETDAFRVIMTVYNLSSGDIEGFSIRIVGQDDAEIKMISKMDAL